MSDSDTDSNYIKPDITTSPILRLIDKKECYMGNNSNGYIYKYEFINEETGDKVKIKTCNFDCSEYDDEYEYKNSDDNDTFYKLHIGSRIILGDDNCISEVVNY